MKEYLTALLLMRLPSMLYTHWMMYPSRACTLSRPLIVTLCSVLLWTEYIAPGKAVTRTSPLSTVPLCTQFGSMGTSLCLQMRVSWSEQSPWSSRETLKTAMKGSTHTVSSRGSAFNYGDYNYTVCALIFAGFNVRGFRGSAAIREYFVREYFNITLKGHVHSKPIDDVMRN